MTVEIRRAGDQWLVEVKGEPIGIAANAIEARELAEYWARRLECVATWRVGQAVGIVAGTSHLRARKHRRRPTKIKIKAQPKQR